MDCERVALAGKGVMLAPKPEPAVPRSVARVPLFVLAVVELALEAEDGQRVGWLRPHAHGEPAPLELSAVDCQEAVAHA